MLKLVIVEDDFAGATVNRGFATKTPELSVVATFYDGRNALEFLLKNPVDLILLDLGLPDISGLELLTELRRQGKLIDAIVISGSDEVDKVKTALSLGAMDYLIKPIIYDRFLEAVQKFLVRRSLLSKDKCTQADIDQIARASSYNVMKKGLQQQTLDKIWDCLNCEKNRRRFMTSDQISDETGFTKVTVRRYMNYLIEQRKAASRTNYSTGGRPSIEYSILVE